MVRFILFQRLSEKGWSWGYGPGAGVLSSVDFFAGLHWNAVSGTGSGCRSSAVFSALGRAADAQKRVPTIKSLPARGMHGRLPIADPHRIRCAIPSPFIKPVRHTIAMRGMLPPGNRFPFVCNTTYAVGMQAGRFMRRKFHTCSQKICSQSKFFVNKIDQAPCCRR